MDFVTGWSDGSDHRGRPVDVVADRAGNLFISDDEANAIYTLTYGGPSGAESRSAGGAAARSSIQSTRSRAVTRATG